MKKKIKPIKYYKKKMGEYFYNLKVGKVFLSLTETQKPWKQNSFKNIFNMLND